ncbi:hypothetical protein GJ496_002249 [Pomphorhynchus laevis]|nr:hypothetical protein GJ496_002249 [Pomphorhynchus laevis]
MKHKRIHKMIKSDIMRICTDVLSEDCQFGTISPLELLRSSGSESIKSLISVMSAILPFIVKFTIFFDSAINNGLSVSLATILLTFMPTYE